MARPKKNPLERRTASLPPIRFTEAELADLHLQASVAGCSVTELVRTRALGGKVSPKRAKTDDSVLTEINRIGVNVNQIARSINRGRDHDPHHLDHVLSLLVATLERLGREQ